MAVVVASGTAAVPASPVDAAHVACGMVVTEDLVLDADLTCPGTALVIGADGVTIDLGGFRVRGSGAGIGVASNNLGEVRSGVTVRNGTIEGFDYGILTYRFEDSVFTGLTLAGNDWGLYTLRGARNRLVHSTVTGSRRFAVYSYEQVFELEVADNRVVDNGGGVSLTFNTHDSRVVRNDISGNGSGVWVLESDHIAIEENDVRANGTGITSMVSSNVGIARNRIVDSREEGVEIVTEFTGDGAIEGNVIAGNDVGILVRHGILERTTVALNQVRGNRSAGMRAHLAFGSGADVHVSGNVFHHNGSATGGDGLELSLGPAVGSVVVAKNKAHHNGGLGIDATGVTDGGKNHATQNGDAAQCVGVAC